MERREKYTFGDNNQRKARLFHFEKQLHLYVEAYRKEWQYSEYSILPEIDGLLKRIEDKEYRQNAFLLPYFIGIPWDKQKLSLSFHELGKIWESEDERLSGKGK